MGTAAGPRVNRRVASRGRLKAKSGFLKKQIQKTFLSRTPPVSPRHHRKGFSLAPDEKKLLQQMMILAPLLPKKAFHFISANSHQRLVGLAPRGLASWNGAKISGLGTVPDYDSLETKMRVSWVIPAVIFCSMAAWHTGRAAPAIEIPPPASLIADHFNEAQLIVLNRDMPASRAQDKGALAPGRMLEHVSVVLRRPDSLQKALDTLAHDQLDPHSPHFHYWIRPQDLPRFAPSPHDVGIVSAWLAAHGLRVNRFSPAGLALDVSGPARAFGSAFGTVLHAYSAADGEHVGPASPPSIPAGLRPVIAGVTLANYFPRPALRRVGGVEEQADGRWQVTEPSPDFTIDYHGAHFEAVVPSDFYTIYNMNYLFRFLPVTEGYRQEVTLVEQSDMQFKDFKRFYNAFTSDGPGVPKLRFSHPGGCADPGLAADEAETAVDAEWATTTAPLADIEIASCQATENSFGVMTAFQNLVEDGTSATVLSVSYTGCETLNGLSFATMWNNIAEAAATEGLSIMVASGDSGVAACDAPGDPGSLYGLAVNALASSPYVTAVGGTDFGDTSRHQVASYWAPRAGNAPFIKSSALSYVPEIVWDDSCASSVISAYLGLTNVTACSAASGGTYPGLLNTIGSGGGASIFFAKPDWQSLGLRGVPNDHARDLPDISLFAADGVWNHFYLYCMSDAAHGGHPCKYPARGVASLLSAGGGTSFAAPAMAGLIAYTASYKQFISYHNYAPLRLGNVAPRLYQLAELQYGQPLLVDKCQANLGNKIGTGCIFHEVTRGDNDVPCFYTALPNCIDQILSKDSKRLVNTYAAGLGYNQATGLGSVDATNFVFNY